LKKRGEKLSPNHAKAVHEKEWKFERTVVKKKAASLFWGGGQRNGRKEGLSQRRGCWEKYSASGIIGRSWPGEKKFGRPRPKEKV